MFARDSFERSQILDHALRGLTLCVVLPSASPDWWLAFCAGFNIIDKSTIYFKTMLKHKTTHPGHHAQSHWSCDKNDCEKCKSCAAARQPAALFLLTECFAQFYLNTRLSRTLGGVGWGGVGGAGGGGGCKREDHTLCVVQAGSSFESIVLE